jgi:hypothetical protein
VAVALSQEHELELHIRGARRNGLDGTIGEALLQSATTGRAGANAAFAVAQRVMGRGRGLMRTAGTSAPGPPGQRRSHNSVGRGIESVVLESRSRDYVGTASGPASQQGSRQAGGAGAGERLGREGIVHHGIGFQFDGERHRIPIATDRRASIVVYGQTEI